MKMNAKGILIVVSGHSYYGRMAYNLAVSIKATEDFPIAVVYCGRSLNHLSDQQKEVFNHVIYDYRLPENSGAKLYAYENSPFEETLLLDADMLWSPKKKPSELFEELKEVEFTGITEGYHNGEDHGNPIYFYWADVGEIREKYKIEGTIYQWRSEVLYFKKSKKVKQLFTKALKIYEKPNLSTVKKYADGIPDELAINIAAAQLGIEPHKLNWQPSFWWKINNMVIPPLPKVYEYYLVSFGSNIANSTVKKLYDRIMKAAAYKMEVQHVFPLTSKRDFLPERAKM